ncbi:unnamed protein product [Linum trigynum]|uniref:Reverse transcriptase zinc-binding domain-containing protein n=1 Tax=Linum trigynum TaxID=586398 RepID=A0AAV2GWG8_9ROSI
MFDAFWNHVCINPGGGACVSFWYDCWIPKTILADSFSRIAAICFHQKILTIDNLKRRCWALANQCKLCRREEESVNHLFVDCDFTKEVWSGINSFSRGIQAPVNGIVSAIRSWPTEVSDCIEGWISYCSLHVVCWTVWRERNNRIFNQSQTTRGALSKKIIRSIVEWVIAKGKVSRDLGSA